MQEIGVSCLVFWMYSRSEATGTSQQPNHPCMCMKKRTARITIVPACSKK